MNGRNSYIYRQVGEKDGTWHFELGGDMAEEDLSGHSTSPAFVDFDSDGIPEILLGCEDGFYYHLRNSDWKKGEGANRAPAVDPEKRGFFCHVVTPKGK